MPSIEHHLAQLVCRPAHTGVALSAHSQSSGSELHLGAGDLDADKPYFAASTTKLYTTAVVLQLVAERRVALDDPFRRHLQGAESARLHLWQGRDCTGEITLRQLLAHTSGLPDYFEPLKGGQGLYATLVGGQDRGWTFAQAMEMARAQGARHAPGQTRRASYADTNFQLLGQVIEAVEAAPLARVMQRRLFAPLGLANTWLYDDPADLRPHPLRYRHAALHIPLAMASFQADGGVVTTARDALAFARAFFEGRLFDAGQLQALQDWRPMAFPLSYGTGMMRFALPRWMTGFRRVPPLLGHSGLSGAFAFHAPDAGLTFAGTVNQIDKPDTSFRLLVKLALAWR